MTTTFEINRNILAEYESDGGWKPWGNSIDAQVAREATCENPSCKRVGLQFRGYIGYGERHAIAICPKCGHQFEF